MYRVAIGSLLLLVAVGCGQPGDSTGSIQQAGIVWGDVPPPGPEEGFPTLARSCPCDTAPSHGLYVVCATSWAKAAAASGVIDEAQRDQVIAGAARSSCGRAGTGSDSASVKSGPPA
jgi:hypothetical protein